MSEFNIAIVSLDLPEKSLDKLRHAFDEVHYHPDGNIPKEILAKADVWFNWRFPDGVSISEVPRMKLVQLSSAGANQALGHPFFQDVKARDQVTLSTASGIHAYTIPQYAISQAISLYGYIAAQAMWMRAHADWPERFSVAHAVQVRGAKDGDLIEPRTIYGRTAGLLGYGHIGREIARVLKAMNVDVVVANSSGKARVDDGYIVPGTGDLEGTIPSAYYSTNDPASFKEFLSRSDILIASLPSTPNTQYMLKDEHFSALPDGAIFINVGRGDLVKSEVLLEALNSPSGLSGAALDVTDPEPLPKDHPLYSHPHVILTPHTSGLMEGYNEKACDLFIANVEGLREGKTAMNRVSFEKGY